MDSNPDDNNNKKYLIIKVPANVENKDKCIERLGGLDKIFVKVILFIYCIKHIISIIKMKTLN
jgi:hypothetical protein